MGKYDFIKTGNLLYWHDPDNGLSDGAYRVISAPENMEDDSIILISSGTSEAEVLPSELSPISTGRSHKEDFLRWKAEREAEGMEFYNRLSEVMDTEDDLAVGCRRHSGIYKRLWSSIRPPRGISFQEALER